MSAASTVAETFYSRLLWRSRNTCLKLSAPYLGTDALSAFACSGLRWPFAAFLAVAGSAWGGKPMGNGRVLSSITLKRRRSWLLAASALVSSSLGVSEPALAQCSPVDGSGNATCLSGTYTDTVPQPANTFPAPINYSATANLPLHVTLDSGVNVTLSNPVSPFREPRVSP